MSCTVATYIQYVIADLIDSGDIEDISTESAEASENS